MAVAEQEQSGVVNLGSASQDKTRGYWRDAWRRLRRNRLALIGIFVILFNIILAVFADYIAPYTYNENILDDGNSAPSWVVALFPIMTAADEDRYSFSGQAGDQITVDMRSPDFLTRITLVDADNESLIAANGDQLFGNDATFDFTLPADGQYELVATMAEIGSQGDYDLSVTANSADGSSLLTYSSVLEGDLDTGDWPQAWAPSMWAVAPDFNRYTFSGDAGEAVLVDIASEDGISTRVLIFDADNQLVASADQELVATLPSDGDYTLVVRAADGLTEGDYSLSVFEVRTDTYPADISGSFVAHPFAWWPIPDINTHRFSGNRGDLVRFDRSGEGDAQLVLMDEQRQVVASATNTLMADLPYNGEYVLVTLGESVATAGDYVISLNEVVENGFGYGNLVEGDMENTGYVRINENYSLGADSIGRDLFSRTIYGARISLSVAFVGPLVSMIVGLSLGLVAGYWGGATDNIIMRVVDIMYAFPTILLIILMMSYFRASTDTSEPGTFVYDLNQFNNAQFGGMLFIFIGIGLTSWMNTARLTRGQVLSVRKQEYIEAAISIGTSRRSIITKHVLPNILGPIIVAETLTIPTYISYEAFLSFIGLGVNRPRPSWGSMIADGAQAISSYPNQALFPAIALFMIMFAFNFLGDGLRDALDPRTRQT